jgi:hypothetical protein
MDLLRFQPMDSNAKLKKHMRAACDERGLRGDMLQFSLPAGWSCPAALDCDARTDRITGKVTDGAHTQFRCYAATMESRRGSVRESRWRNFDLLRAVYRDAPNNKTDALANLILASLATYRQVAIVRIHVSGDFYNRPYFGAWVGVALAMPNTRFYAYTKAAVPYMSNVGLPSNLSLIASRGGRHDHLIDAYGLREARVVFSTDEADALGYAIDDDDTLAAFGTESFALLLHGTQPAGSVASKALSAIKLERIG